MEELDLVDLVAEELGSGLDLHKNNAENSPGFEHSTYSSSSPAAVVQIKQVTPVASVPNTSVVPKITSMPRSSPSSTGVSARGSPLDPIPEKEEHDAEIDLEPVPDLEPSPDKPYSIVDQQETTPAVDFDIVGAAIDTVVSCLENSRVAEKIIEENKKNSNSICISGGAEHGSTIELLANKHLNSSAGKPVSESSSRTHSRAGTPIEVTTPIIKDSSSSTMNSGIIVFV